MTTATIERAADPRDRVLEALWTALTEADELGRIFVQPPPTLEAFRARFQDHPVYAQYAEGDDGLRLGPVIWGTPLLSGLVLGIWIPRALRRGKAKLRMVEELFALAFREYPVLLVVEYPPGVKLCQHYGFTGMTIPELGDQGDLWFGYLTRQTWRRRVGGSDG